MRLYAHYRSSTSYRLRIALNLKRLDYEVMPINLLKSEQRSDAFRALNPFAGVPVLELQGQHYAQSMAILEWLDERFPDRPLLPPDVEDRFAARELAFAIATELHAPLNLPVLRYLKNELGLDQDRINDWYCHWLDKTLAPLEQRLAQRDTGDFLFDAPGLFESVLIPQLYNARRFAFDLEAMPRMRRIETACLALPEFRKAHPDNQPDSTEGGEDTVKLASLRSGRDGKLAVVSADLSRCVAAEGIAPTLQAALDDWAAAEPELRGVFQQLDAGTIRGEPFDQTLCASPLPRAYQWADGSAYINHVELVRKARGAEVPESFYSDPLIYQGGSDVFLPPREPIRLPDEAWGCDFEGEIAVITDDVPMGVSSDDAVGHVKLVMLCNDISLRNLIPGELAKGFGFFQSKPPSAFSPVAVTPDMLGPAWRGGKVHLPLRIDHNGAPFGRAQAGEDATFSLSDLIAHAARTRPLSAGTIIGSGTVSNRGADGGPGKPVSEGGAGYSCIAELRMIETLVHGEPVTPFLRCGDTLAIEMLDQDARSIFGRIEQEVV